MSPINFWQSERIRLRAYEPGDAEILWQWNQDSERNRTLDFLWPPQSKAAVQKQVEGSAFSHLENDSYQWIIETLDGVPLGTIGTHHCDLRNGTFFYAVDIAEEHRGKGYAAEALKLVLRYYFQELRYQKATAEIHSDNAACIRLHEKFGSQCEGLLRCMFYSQGSYLDVLYYGMTAEEFKALYPQV